MSRKEEDFEHLLEALERINGTASTRLELPSEPSNHLHLLSALAALEIIKNAARAAIEAANLSHPAQS